MKITKERAKDILEFGAGRIISPITDDEIRELARIALASIKAEPVAYMYKDNLHADARFSLHKRFGNWSQEDINEYEITEIPLYTAAPAPAPANAEPVAWLWSHRKHPSEVSLVRPEDDERAEGAHWSGWSCQALYAVPPAQVSEPDRSMFEKWWESEHGSPLDSWDSLRTTDGYCDDGIDGQFEAWNACRAAMLQGVEQPQSAQQNIPEIIPATQFKPVADLYGLTSPTGDETSFTFDAVEARDFIDGGWSCQEYVELERFQEAVSGNSPVIQDGWVMVPVEPTEDMIVNGFESEPDESFSDEKEWEAYEAMSGCQQAAHRAKLCWAAMIAAAPKLE
ncbi:TPA: hypothetical protein ACXIWB_002201 [Enterobacter roggenkampii]